MLLHFLNLHLTSQAKYIQASRKQTWQTKPMSRSMKVSANENQDGANLAAKWPKPQATGQATHTGPGSYPSRLTSEPAPC